MQKAEGIMQKWRRYAPRVRKVFRRKVSVPGRPNFGPTYALCLLPYAFGRQAILMSSAVAGTSLMIWEGSGPTPM